MTLYDRYMLLFGDCYAIGLGVPWLLYPLLCEMPQWKIASVEK